ncbi:RHS repeat protein [Pseudomonas sp. YJ42]|uniref:RHS repeat protein n=1 Tax=Pseudomonas sp. YJ42 TaxID=3392115 RepID=UPI00399F555A
MTFLSRGLRFPLLFALAFSALPSQAEEDFNSAATDVYQDPGLNLNRDFSSSNQVDSIDPFSGALKIVVRDLHIPGNGGLDIDIIRNYHTINNERGPYNTGHTARTPFGTGWDIHFGRILVPDNNAYRYINSSNNPSSCKKNNVATRLNPYLELPDGSRELLANSSGSDYAYTTRNRWIGKCLPTAENSNSTGGLVVHSPDGKKYTFNLLGSVSPDKPYMAYFVTKIEDLDGNYLQFSYIKPSGNTTTKYTLLSTITASDGRKVEFGYDDATASSIGLRPRLTSIKGEGKTVSYSYIDASWFSGTNELPHYLASVKYPDGTSWSYKYLHRSDQANFVPGRFSISSMTSPYGLTTSYTFEYRQMGPLPAEKVNVVTRRSLSTIAGSDQPQQVWKYTYTKGYSPNNDKTLVAGPESCVRYEHIGSDTISKATITNELWKLGLQVKKETLNGSSCSSVIRTEQTTWASQKISAQNEVRRYGTYSFSQTQNGTYAAIEAKRVITQNGSTYTTDFSYDADGQPIQIKEDGQRSRTKTITYTKPGGNWVLGRISTQAVSGVSGNLSYTYNSAARVTQESNYGVSTKFSYSNKGDISSQTDANGRVTRFADYYRGVPRLVTYADGSTLKRTVNSGGTVATQTDELGRVTSYTYDKMDRLIAITPPRGVSAKASIAYRFSSSGTSETLTRGSYKRVRNYNQLGQLIGQTESGSGSPIVVTAKYDSQGNRTFTSNPSYASAASGERYSYDALNRVIKVTHADGSSVVFAHQTGNKMVITDERGNTTTQEFVAYAEPDDRLLSRITQPGAIATSLGIDNLGRVTSMTQGGLTRTYTYSSKGFLVSENNPETGITQYTHDSVGNVLSKKVGSAAPDVYGYDARNRLVSITYGGSALKLVNSYDKAGRVTDQVFGPTTWSFAYDVHDNLLSESLSLTSPPRTFTIFYRYNAADGLESMVYPSGLVVDYLPDAYGRPTKAGVFAKAISYHANGSIQKIVFGNDRTLSVSLDARLRPTEHTVYGADMPMQQRLAYDSTSNVTQISDLQNSAFTQKLSYDGLNRLVSAAGAWGAANFSYNNRGDLTSQKVGTRTIGYTYNGQGRLATLSGSVEGAVSYDVKGNILTARGQYGYDDAGNLTWLCLNPRADCSVKPDQQFRYDARQRRVVSLDASGEKLVHVYGQNGMLAREDDLTTGTVKEFVYVGTERIAHKELCSSADSDGDGLPDCYELRLGFDPKNASDGFADSDGDGVLSHQEYRLGTKLRNVDSDDDGMPDGWELKYGLNPKSAGDANLDLNGDGLTNLQHYQNGTPAASIWPAIIPPVNTILNN